MAEPQFYTVLLGTEEYEVEARSEDEAWQRALTHYRALMREKGLKVITHKL